MNNMQHPPSTPFSHAAAAPATSTSVNKIEIDGRGQPVNVNKKHNSRGRGGRSAGRGGSFSRGGHSGGAPTRADSNVSRGGLSSRGGAAGSSHQSSFQGTCFKCHAVGHRADSCPVRQDDSQAHA